VEAALYEYRHTRPLTSAAFAVRLLQHAGLVFVLLVVSLAVGMLGFHAIERMPWVDAFLNASMLLGGMGPVFEIPLTDPGKVFAGAYALYCGLLVIAATGVMLAPVVHRIMHRLHWQEETREPGQR
jgi:hypothetical protein